MKRRIASILLVCVTVALLFSNAVSGLEKNEGKITSTSDKGVCIKRIDDTSILIRYSRNYQGNSRDAIFTKQASNNGAYCYKLLSADSGKELYNWNIKQDINFDNISWCYGWRNCKPC